MPDLCWIIIGIGAKKGESGAVIVTGHHDRKYSMLATDDRADVGVTCPGGAFVRRMSNVRMPVGGNPSKINRVWHLAGRFSDVVLPNTNRGILATRAGRNVLFSPRDAVIGRHRGTIRAHGITRPAR